MPAKKKTDTEVVQPTEAASVPATPTSQVPESVNLTQEQWDLARTIMAPGSTSDEFLMFRHWCEEQGYDPLLKQAYFTIQKSKCQECRGAGCKSCDKGWLRVPTFMASIDGLIARAGRFPDFLSIDGAAVYTEDDFMFDAITNQPEVHRFRAAKRGTLAGAWARIQRKGRPAVSFYYDRSEYTGGPVATSKTALMLLKSAQAILLRRTYPEKLGPIYVPEEFGGYIEGDGVLSLPEASPVQQLAAPVETLSVRFETRPGPIEVAMNSGDVVEAKYTEAQIGPDFDKPLPPSIPSVPLPPEPDPVKVGPDHPPQPQPGTFVNGVLTYRNQAGKIYVDIKNGGGVWRLAENAVSTAKDADVKKVVQYVRETIFKNDFELTNHLKKHFRVGTVPALTWEQFAALLRWKEQSVPDMRWYADKIVEQNEPEIAHLENAESPEGQQAYYEALAVEYGIADIDGPAQDFLDGLEKLPDPLSLKAKLYPAGWSWKTHSEELVGMLGLIADGTIDINAPDFVETYGHAG